MGVGTGFPVLFVLKYFLLSRFSKCVLGCFPKQQTVSELALVPGQTVPEGGQTHTGDFGDAVLGAYPSFIQTCTCSGFLYGSPIIEDQGQKRRREADTLTRQVGEDTKPGAEQGLPAPHAHYPRPKIEHPLPWRLGS